MDHDRSRRRPARARDRGGSGATADEAATVLGRPAAGAPRPTASCTGRPRRRRVARRMRSRGTSTPRSRPAAGPSSSRRPAGTPTRIASRAPSAGPAPRRSSPRTSPSARRSSSASSTRPPGWRAPSAGSSRPSSSGTAGPRRIGPRGPPARSSAGSRAMLPIGVDEVAVIRSGRDARHACRRARRRERDDRAAADRARSRPAMRRAPCSPIDWLRATPRTAGIHPFDEVVDERIAAARRAEIGLAAMV